MFKVTVFASKFREQMAHFLGMVKGDQVLQIIQRGDGIKVVMTQEHYLDLMSKGKELRRKRILDTGKRYSSSDEWTELDHEDFELEG